MRRCRIKHTAARGVEGVSIMESASVRHYACETRVVWRRRAVIVGHRVWLRRKREARERSMERRRFISVVRAPALSPSPSPPILRPTPVRYSKRPHPLFSASRAQDSIVRITPLARATCDFTTLSRPLRAFSGKQ